MKPSSFLVAGSFVAIYCSLISPKTIAQSSPEVDQLLQIGTPTNSLNLAVPMGQVNLSDGDLHIEIPLKTIPQPGNATPVTISLVYDSQFWSVFYDYAPDGTETAGFWEPSLVIGTGWRLVVSPFAYDVTAVETAVPDQDCSNPGFDTVPQWTSFTYTASDGTSHVFPLQVTQQGPCYGPAQPYTFGMYSPDGSGYYMALTTDTYAGMGAGTVQVWNSSGYLVSNGLLSAGGGTAEDSNGNILGFTLNGQSYTALMTSGSTWPTTNIYVNTDFNFPNGLVTDYSGSITTVSSIILPDGSTYGFQYDECPNNSSCESGNYHYGELTQMTLPTGSTITFNYQNMSPGAQINAADMRVTSISYSGEALSNCASPSSWSGQTWSICYGPSGQNASVAVTLPPDQESLKNEIMYTGVSGAPSGSDGMMPPVFTPSVRSVYQGLAQGGTLLRSDNYTYNAYNQITGITSQIAGQPSTSVGYGYWSKDLPMLSSKKEYDKNGTVQRETDATYTTNLGPPDGTEVYRGAAFPHFIGHSFSETIYGVGGAASGPMLAQTNFSYDTNPLTTTSGVSGQSVLGLSTHDDVNFGPSQTVRGNLTLISKMVTPNNYITTQTNYYNILGEVTQTIDGNGNATNYDYYSPSWGDSTCSSYTTFNYRYLTQDAAGHLTHTTYNSCMGNVHSVQDQNDLNAGRPGTVYTYDANDRVHQISYPDGGSLTNNYNFTALPASVGSTTAMNYTTGLTTTSVMDGLGRVVHKIDPAGNTVDTTYTPLGQVSSVSNLHAASASPTDGIINFFYDPLGRVVETVRQDGATLWSCFSGIQDSAIPQPNCTQAAATVAGVESWVDGTDEDGRHTQDAYDALGRLVAVMEPNSSGSGLGAETDYEYDALDDLTNVTQWGGPSGSSGARARLFIYDGLGRLSSSANPESGTVTYHYDPDSNVHTRNDARGVTTTYHYDALNRVLSKTYSDEATPLACYQYDSAPVTNGIGRLSNEWTQPVSSGSCSSTLPTGSGYLTASLISAYDPMGRVLNEQQYTPRGAVTGRPYPMTWVYDLAGNVLSSTAGAVSPSMIFSLPAAPCTRAPSFSTTMLMFVNCYDSAGRLLSVTSNAGSGPSSLFTAQGYAPFDRLSNATYGSNGSGNNAVTLTRTYDNRLRITSETDLGNNPPSATSGSATVTITGAEQTQ